MSREAASPFNNTSEWNQVVNISFHRMADLNQLSLEQISQRLTRDTAITHDIPSHWREDELQPAAVLIPFLRIADEWQLLYIRRASHEQDHHSGQVAFAGGKFETDDGSLHQTALREAQEEIGIQPQHVTILGQLGYHHSISRFRITPVVGHMPWPYQLQLDRQEVARAFTIPLAWLADPGHHRIEQVSRDGLGPFPVVYFDEYDGELLWGATARMTLSLLSLLD